MEPSIIKPQQSSDEPAGAPPPATDAQPGVVTSQPFDAAVTPPEASGYRPQMPNAAPAGSVVTPQAGGKNHGLLTVAAVLVLAIVFIGGYFASGAVESVAQTNATQRAKAFIAALNAGNDSTAYAMTSAGLHSQQSENQFSSSLGDLSASKPVVDAQSIAFNSRNVATFSMQEDGLPPTEDGVTTGNFTISLVKSGLTGWKVDSVNVE